MVCTPCLGNCDVAEYCSCCSLWTCLYRLFSCFLTHPCQIVCTLPDPVVSGLFVQINMKSTSATNWKYQCPLLQISFFKKTSFQHGGPSSHGGTSSHQLSPAIHFHWRIPSLTVETPKPRSLPHSLSTSLGPIARP